MALVSSSLAHLVDNQNDDADNHGTNTDSRKYYQQDQLYIVLRFITVCKDLDRLFRLIRFHFYLVIKAINYFYRINYKIKCSMKLIIRN